MQNHDFFKNIIMVDDYDVQKEEQRIAEAL